MSRPCYAAASVPWQPNFARADVCTGRELRLCAGNRSRVTFWSECSRVRLVSLAGRPEHGGAATLAGRTLPEKWLWEPRGAVQEWQSGRRRRAHASIFVVPPLHTYRRVPARLPQVIVLWCCAYYLVVAALLSSGCRYLSRGRGLSCGSLKRLDSRSLGSQSQYLIYRCSDITSGRINSKRR